MSGGVLGGWGGGGGEVSRLQVLYRRLESGLARLDFAPESRPFTPHLTLARVRDRATPAERQRLGQLVMGTEFSSAQAIAVEAVSLISSQLTREGAVYQQISTARLK